MVSQPTGIFDGDRKRLAKEEGVMVLMRYSVDQEDRMCEFR